MRILNLKLENTKFMITHLSPHSSDPLEHDHGDDYQITIPILGTPYLELNKKSNHLNKELRMITPPGEKHFHYSGDEDSRMLLLNIDKNFLDRVISSRFDKEFSDLAFFNYGEGPSDKLVKLAEEAIRLNIFLENDKIKAEELEWEIAETFLSIHEGSHSNYWRKEVTLKYHPLIKKVVDFIEDHFQYELSLDDISKEVHLSKFYLIRAFKDVMGCTPSQYVTKIRLDKAIELLLKTNFDITTICYEVGFGSLNTFERTFKKNYGVTISEFRKQQRY